MTEPGDVTAELRQGEPGAADVQIDSAEADEQVVAECAPPDYDEGTEPHGGRLDDAGGS